MSRRAWTVVGIALLVGFAGFAFTTFRSSMTPYVSFADARSDGRVVQVAGGLDRPSARYDQAQAALFFNLVDAQSGDKLPVVFHGLRPSNFGDAISIVAIGNWNAKGGEFDAQKLLVKCPSKYQGAEIKSYGG
jgi:cytochrome c-type biogenesis protein CcmE